MDLLNWIIANFINMNCAYTNISFFC
ncbi:UNVERIFIED_CONTAM: hypothetical protein NCL1_46561 [Trichonephila clavipes]